MKSKTIIIFVLLLIAGAAVVGLQRAGMFKSKPKQRGEIVDRHVFIPTPVNLKQLTIEDMSGKKLSFIKNASGDWEITPSAGGRVKSGSVEKLIATLADMKYVDRFDPLTRDGLDDIQTCLAKPRWIVSLYDADGVAHTLLVGREAPAVGTSKRDIETYVKVQGSPSTCIVAEDLATLLCKTPEDFCDKTDTQLRMGDEFISLPGSVLDYNLPTESTSQENDTTKDNE